MRDYPAASPHALKIIDAIDCGFYDKAYSMVISYDKYLSHNDVKSVLKANTDIPGIPEISTYLRTRSIHTDYLHRKPCKSDNRLKMFESALKATNIRCIETFKNPTYHNMFYHDLNSQTMFRIIRQNNVILLKTLLKNSHLGFNPCASRNCFADVVTFKRCEIIEMLLNHTQNDDLNISRYILTEVFGRGYYDVFKILRDHGIMESDQYPHLIGSLLQYKGLDTICMDTVCVLATYDNMRARYPNVSDWINSQLYPPSACSRGISWIKSVATSIGKALFIYR